MEKWALLRLSKQRMVNVKVFTDKSSKELISDRIEDMSPRGKIFI